MLSKTTTSNYINGDIGDLVIVEIFYTYIYPGKWYFLFIVVFYVLCPKNLKVITGHSHTYKVVTQSDHTSDHRFLVLLVLLVSLASAEVFFGGAGGVTGGGEGGGVFFFSAIETKTYTTSML